MKDVIKREKLYLVHIFECARDVGAYVKDKTPDEFYKPGILQDAVLHRMEIMGESSKKLSEETKKEMPNIPWNKVAGLRDRIAHGYFDLDLPRLWLIIQNDLPSLKSTVQKLCKERYGLEL